jgi:hypothetical protein
MDNFQNCDSYINISLSQTYRSYHHNWLNSYVWALAFFFSHIPRKIILQGWVVNPMPNHSNPRGLMFFYRVFSVSWQVLILKHWELVLHLCIILPYACCPGTIVWTFMHKTWLDYMAFSVFISSHPLARCISTGLHATSLAHHDNLYAK